MASCDGVLEYIPPAMLSAVQREIDRVPAPGGTMRVTGTSNRLSPRGVRPGRRFVNDPPRRLDHAGGGGLFARPGLLSPNIFCVLRKRD